MHLDAHRPGLDWDASRPGYSLRAPRSAEFAADRNESPLMITVHLRYEIDADKLAEFREYGERWIRLVNKLGGVHHGYFLPSEGDSDEAFALFTFPSLADYEQYRLAAADDPECIEAYEFAVETKCIRRYERRFLSPVFD